MRRRAQPGLGQQRAERAALLGQVDRLRRGADDRHAGVLEPLGQAERGLPAELHDHPDHARPAGRPAGGVLGVADLQHVLEGQRLEVEPVGGVVVGGDRLRVAVDHDGLVAGRAQRHHRVHAGVVELDALPDPVRPGAEDQHLRPVRRRDLGLLVVGRVVVRRASPRTRPRRCRRSCRPAARPSRCRRRAHAVLAGQLRAQRGELPVGQAGPLGPAQQRLVEHRRVDDLARAGRPARRSGRGTTGRSAGRRGDLGDRRAQPQRPLDGVEPAVVRRPQRVERVLQRGAGRVRLRSRSRPPWSPSSASPCQRLGEVAAQAHRLADRLHRGGQLRVGAGELLEREPRDLHHDVVQRRLERGRGLAG